MLKIGITGGIGSGKSFVCKIFEAFQIPVYYSDYRAKILMNDDIDLKNEIIKAFGQVYDGNGKLNRLKLAEIIFNDKDKLQQINSLVHPAVAKDFAQWAETQKSPYVIQESAITFESGNYKFLDFTIEVWAPLELRIERAMKRDNQSREKILKRIKNQYNEQKKINLADFIIINDGAAPLLPQITNLHKFFLKQSR